MDSNCGPLASEATALTTEPQPLPMNKFLGEAIFQDFIFPDLDASDLSR